ncbi:MAG: ExbD/TolR family protein [Janthinobacterium lividum]
MAFGGLKSRDAGRPMADINMTPFIDVMLVLLVIFIVGAPVLTRALALDLPPAHTAPQPEPAVGVTLAIDATGQLYWNGAPLAAAALDATLAAAARRDPAPDLLLRADARTPYGRIAALLAAAQRAGLTRIGFVVNPQG